MSAVDLDQLIARIDRATGDALQRGMVEGRAVTPLLRDCRVAVVTLRQSLEEMAALAEGKGG